MKESREKLADREKTDATLKAIPKSRGRKHATAVGKGVIVLGAKLAKATDAHVRLVNISAQLKLTLQRHGQTWETVSYV